MRQDDPSFQAVISQFPAAKTRLSEACPLQLNESVNAPASRTRWVLGLDVDAVTADRSTLCFRASPTSDDVHNLELALRMTFPGWCRDSYLLVPAAVYRSNRFVASEAHLLSEDSLEHPGELLVSPDFPQLSKDSEGELEVLHSHCASPMAALYFAETKTAKIIELPQDKRAGFRIREDLQAGTLTVEIASPFVRKVLRSVNLKSAPSPDKGVSLKAGEAIQWQYTERSLECAGGLDDFFRQVHAIIVGNQQKCPLPKAELSFSQARTIQEVKFNRDNWVEADQNYATFLVPGRVNNYELGWTGGMQVQAPLLKMGGERTRERCRRNLDFFFEKAQSPGGLFYAIYKDGQGRGEMFEDRHLMRRSGDGLLYMLKQLQALDADDRKPKWIEGTRRCADRLAAIVEENQGHIPHYVDQESGELRVSGSTSGAILLSALVEASAFFEEPRYLAAAELGGATMQADFLDAGLFGGGPNDAVQTPDSESCYGLVEGYTALYEGTGKSRWLAAARKAAHLFSTWVTDYNHRFEAGTTMAHLGVETNGTVWANLRNKHAAPGICTYSGSALLRLYRYTRDRSHLDLLQRITRALPQFLSRADKPITAFPTMEPLPEGWMAESVFFNDMNYPYPHHYASPPGEVWAGSCWCEISLMLTWAELPSIYVDADRQLLWALDAVEARIEGDRLVLRNPTKQAASYRIWLDSASSTRHEGPGERIVEIAPGETSHLLLEGTRLEAVV